MSGPGASVPIAVYRGRGCGIAKIKAYEDFLGRPVDYVEDFTIEAPTTWAQFDGCWLTSSAQAGLWGPQLAGRKLALALPACVMGTTWADEAAGVNDAHWQAAGTYLASHGLADAILRIGREMNGGWYAWGVREGGQPAYIAGYRHVVDVLRSVPGQQFRFNWNPYLGVQQLTSRGAESLYPGDSWADEIGVDVYDDDRWVGGVYPGKPDAVTTAQQRQIADKLLTMWDSLRGWHNLARAHGKPLTFPEWGLRLWKDGGTYHGGGDNAVLVDTMGQFITGLSVPTWHGMWEDPWGAGVADPDTLAGRPIAAPQARAAFLAWFGS